MLPNRIKLSQKATDKLRYIKTKTGVTPNILARIAIMLAIKDDSGLDTSGIADFDGQELNKTVLFGDHAQVYDVMINQYCYAHSIDIPIQQLIASLIEIGVFKMGHVKDLKALSF